VGGEIYNYNTLVVLLIIVFSAVISIKGQPVIKILFAAQEMVKAGLFPSQKVVEASLAPPQKVVHSRSFFAPEKVVHARCFFAPENVRADPSSPSEKMVHAHSTSCYSWTDIITKVFWIGSFNSRTDAKK